MTDYPHGAPPNFEVVGYDVEDGQTFLVIRDVGPWDVYKTVTNAAEYVVDTLFETGALKEGMRLRYYDSEGDLDEILVADGKFAGFAPGPGRR